MEYATNRPTTSVPVGQMFFAIFGTLWMTGWCLQRHGPDFPTLALILLAGTTLFLWAWSEYKRGNVDSNEQEDPSVHKVRQRTFRLVNLIQWTAMVAVAMTLNATGNARWIVPAVILVVGVHLIPLAHTFKSPRNYVIGSSLIVVALAYPLMSGGGPDYPAGEFATGAILWLGALHGFLNSRDNRQSQAGYRPR